MTAEELLKQMSAEPFAEEMVCCVIDPETRVIDVPAEYQLLGVESDEKVERMYFQCPKIVGDNIDLSKLALRVNFRNANDQKDQYIVDDVEISGDNITFSWLLSRRVTQYKGNVSFIVCAVKASGEEITNEWNTTLATAQVLEGLEADITLPEEDTDVVKQLIAVATQKITDVQNATSSANTAASNADIKAQEAANAAEDARGVIDQITKDSYLHTTTQTFVDTVKASPTAYGNAIPEQIEGYIKQDTTKGLNIMPDNYSLLSNTTCKISDNGKLFLVTSVGTNGASAFVRFNLPFTLEKLKGKTLYASDFTTEKTGNGTPRVIIFKESGGNGSLSSVGTIGSGGSLKLPDTFEENVDHLSVYLYANNQPNTSASDSVTYKNLWLSLDSPLETWEPYTGGQPSPNPDYPQIVHGVGDMAFFDGEFADGGYSHTTGEPNLNANYIRSTNDICYPLKLGDRIKFVYEKPVFFAILLYDKNETITIKTSVKTSEWEYEVTKEQERFKFYINDPDGTTAMSAKRLTVTINGMYAVCVKSVGKNLFNADLFSTGTMNGVTVINNGDGSFTLKGTVTKSENICSDHFSLDYGTYNLIDYIEGNYATGSYARSQVYSSKVDGNIFISNEDASDKKSTAELKASDNYVLRFRIQEGVTYDCTLKPMLFMQGDETFVPYQSNTAYIPISAPLFDGDQIIKRNGEYKLRRKWGMVVFDGSEDESWKRYTADYFALKLPFQVSETHKGYCDRFMWELYENFSSDLRAGVSKLSFLWVTYKSIDTEENFKTWLQSHPISVVYQLAEPTEESLSPEAQKAIHSIMACDELTTLEIVGVPEDAEIQNQFLLPRNIDGALNTTAYCTAKRNEIALEELVAQSLDARVNKLEVDNESLNLQTLIVE